MQIFILRHGQAEPQKTTDAARNLTVSGRADVAATVTKSLLELERVDQIWVSPLVRAQQTATIANDILALESTSRSITTTHLLSPDASLSLLVEALQHSGAASVLLVSHQPLVGQFIDLLCGSVNCFEPMDTSSLAYVECDTVAADLGVFRWLKHTYE